MKSFLVSSKMSKNMAKGRLGRMNMVQLSELVWNTFCTSGMYVTNVKMTIDRITPLLIILIESYWIAKLLTLL
jgi:hypothetical protein